MARATNLKAVLEEALTFAENAAPRGLADRLRAELEGLDRCLLKAAPLEPLFVLRAQDVSAPGIVEEWAARTKVRAGHNTDGYRKAMLALDTAAEMRAWQAQHPERVKVPD